MVDDWYGFDIQVRNWGYVLPEATKLILATYEKRELRMKCKECNNVLYEMSGVCWEQITICSSGHLRDKYIR